MVVSTAGIVIAGKLADQEQSVRNSITAGIWEEKSPTLTAGWEEEGKSLWLHVEDDQLLEYSELDYEIVYQAEGGRRLLKGREEVKGETVLVENLITGSCSEQVCVYDYFSGGVNIDIKLSGQAAEYSLRTTIE